jgi:hypothetical protein
MRLDEVAEVFFGLTIEISRREGAWRGMMARTDAVTGVPPDPDAGVAQP